MTMHDHRHRILERIAIATFVVGIVFAALGVYLVYLGASGESEFSFFGQEFRSGNAGIAAIFIGGVLIVLNVRRLLASFDKSVSREAGTKAAGELKVTEVRATQDALPRRADELGSAQCLVDFWVSNEGGSEVTLTAVEFEVLDTARCELTKGRMESSATYDFDLTDLREVKQRAQCPVSQMIRPGESDRFTVRLVAAGLGSGVFAVWSLRPTLVTNVGRIVGKDFEAWLPLRDPDSSWEQMKAIQGMEQQHGVRR